MKSKDNFATSSQGSFYIPQLDGLRFIALFLVFLHHLNLSFIDFSSFTTIQRVFLKLHQWGWIGVDLFLCLSAFLITRLLKMEFETTGSIGIFHFYIRRSLRIWPLYFLFCILGFLIFPLLGVFEVSYGSAGHLSLLRDHLLPFFLLLGNWSTAVHGYAESSALSALWTISLEEQFYILWPPVLIFVLRRRLPFLVLSLALFAATVLLRYWLIFNAPHPAFWVLTPSRLDPLILGSLIGYYYVSFQNLLTRRYLFYVTTICSAFLFVHLARFPDLRQMSIHGVWQLSATATVSSLLLLGVLSRNRLTGFFGNPVMSYLGKISYGLYVFHGITIEITNRFFLRHLDGERGFVISIAYILVAFTLTTAGAALSYALLEKPFLRLKHKYTSIGSRPI